MKYILTILLCLFGTAYGQTSIGYFRYDTSKFYTTKVDGRGSVDVTGNVRFTGLLQKSAGTDSVVVRDANGNLGTTAKGALFVTPTWQQTLTAGSTLTGDNTIAGGGFNFTWNNALGWAINGADDMIITSTNGGLSNNQFGSSTGGIFMSSGEIASGLSSDIFVASDTVFINSSTGQLKMDTLNNVSSQNTLMGWVQSSGVNRGKVGYVTIGSGLSLSSGQLTATGSGGTVTSVAQSFTGGLISVAGSPITGAGTLALTVAGTSGGIPYFSSTSTWASSGLLAANALLIGGGAGAAPSSTTTGTGILTWLGTPSSANLRGALTDENGTGVALFDAATTPTFTTGFQIGGAAVSRKMIVGNGTNFVPSTETWAAPGTSGNVLTSNGTNWTSAAPSGGGLTVGTTTIASGTIGRVLFEGAGNVLQQDGGLAWDNTNKILGITGGGAATFPFTITNSVNGVTGFKVTNQDGGSNAQIQNQLVNDVGSLAYYGIAGSAFNAYAPLNSGAIFFGGNGAPVNIFTQSALPINFYTSGTLAQTIASGGIITMQAYGAGSATFDASGNISSVSDIRLKNLQGYYYGGLKEIMKIKPIVYKWNEKSGMETKENYIGFSAQNVKESLGEGSYGINKDGYLSIQDRAILAALVRAVQEQQKEIEDLKTQLKNNK